MKPNFQGCWKNAFGSIMLIEKYDPTTGEFSGKYSSTTGSSGTYYIHGYTQPNSSPTTNYPVTMTISWRTIVKGESTKDNSQYWTSMMTGVYTASTDSLKLMNVISAAREFPDVKVTGPGNYPETLRFNRQDSSACSSIPARKYWNGPAEPSVYQPLSSALSKNKKWTTEPGILENVTHISFDPIDPRNAHKEFAMITGKASIGTNQYTFLGECSYLTPENKAALSITFTYRTTQGSYTLGLSGILDASVGTLDLLESRTQGYTQAIYSTNAVVSRIYKSI